MEYYKDIWSLPIYNWNMVMVKNNYNFLKKESTFIPPNDVKNIEDETAHKLWIELNDQYSEEFGFNESATTVLEKKRDIGILKADYIVTGDKFKLTQIEIKEFQLESSLETGETEYNPNKEIGILSKYIGTMIDTRKTSVHQYYIIKQNIMNQK